MRHGVPVVSTVALLAAVAALFPSISLAVVTTTGDTSIGSQILVGNTTFGTYRIDSGSTATVSSMIIGSQANALGFATVTGAGTQVTLTSSAPGLDVGVSGIGRLDITNGGVMLLSSTSGQLRIARITLAMARSLSTALVRCCKLAARSSLGTTSAGPRSAAA